METEWKPVMKKKGIRSLRKKLQQALDYIHSSSTVTDMDSFIQKANEYQEQYSLAVQILFQYPEFSCSSPKALQLAKQLSLKIPKTTIKDRYSMI